MRLGDIGQCWSTPSASLDTRIFQENAVARETLLLSGHIRVGDSAFPYAGILHKRSKDGIRFVRGFLKLLLCIFVSFFSNFPVLYQ